MFLQVLRVCFGCSSEFSVCYIIFSERLKVSVTGALTTSIASGIYSELQLYDHNNLN